MGHAATGRGTPRSATRTGHRAQNRSGPVRFPPPARGVACGAVGASSERPLPERTARLEPFTVAPADTRTSPQERRSTPGLEFPFPAGRWASSPRSGSTAPHRVSRYPVTLAMFRRRTLLATRPARARRVQRERHAPTAVTPPPGPAASSASAAAGDERGAERVHGGGASVPDAGPYEGPWIGATVLQAPIFSEMELPARQAGREGRQAVAPRVSALRREGAGHPRAAQEGQLPRGLVRAPRRRLRLRQVRDARPRPPALQAGEARPTSTGPLPYTYGVNVANGTPLYRQVPSREERLKLEPWLVEAEASAEDVDDDNPYATRLRPDRRRGRRDASSIGESAGEREAPTRRGGRRRRPTAARPTVTLEDLQESDGPIARRMVKGFFLSLDHQFGVVRLDVVEDDGGPGRARRPHLRQPSRSPTSTACGSARTPRATPTKTLPVAHDRQAPGGLRPARPKRWTLDAAHKHASQAEGVRRALRGGRADRARRRRVGGTEFWETDEGWWMRVDRRHEDRAGPAARQARRPREVDRREPHRQTLVAFEGDEPGLRDARLERPQRARDGRPGRSASARSTSPRRWTATPTRRPTGRTRSRTSPTSSTSTASYALHGAFWHAEFGHVKSHGCVNLAPWDAKALFGWTDPQLPEGWHGVVATKEQPGTRVIVHDEGAAAPATRGPRHDADAQCLSRVDRSAAP